MTQSGIFHILICICVFGNIGKYFICKKTNVQVRYICICMFENIAFVCLKTQRTGATDKDVLPGFVSPIPCLLLLCTDFQFRFVRFCLFFLQDFFSIHFFENVLYKFCHTIGTYVGTSRHVMYLLGTSRPPVLLFYLGLTFVIFIKTEIS